jgi:hypothetical protein
MVLGDVYGILREDGGWLDEIGERVVRALGTGG